MEPSLCWAAAALLTRELVLLERRARIHQPRREFWNEVVAVAHVDERLPAVMPASRFLSMSSTVVNAVRAIPDLGRPTGPRLPNDVGGLQLVAGDS